MKLNLTAKLFKIAMSVLYGGDCQVARKNLLKLDFLEEVPSTSTAYYFKLTNPDYSYPNNHAILYPKGPKDLKSKAMYAITPAVEAGAPDHKRLEWVDQIHKALVSAGFDVKVEHHEN